MDNELLLFDRVNLIKDTILKYGEENFYLSFSGGKDSTILHYLIDMALPNNTIPRVFVNTGIEYNLLIDFVRLLAKNDNRIKIIAPSTPIKPMLERVGYPFKSKKHSSQVNIYQRKGLLKGLQVYLGMSEEKKLSRPCPKKLHYQFTPENTLKISSHCCDELKKKPFEEYSKISGRNLPILGLRNEEGETRRYIKCVVFSKNGNLQSFYPLVKVNEEWEQWFIEKYQIKLCDLYYPPYNFKRTGCKGCPYARDLQHCLDVLEAYFPAERKQCEIIWKPVYEEYRKLRYRSMKNNDLDDMF